MSRKSHKNGSAVLYTVYPLNFYRQCTASSRRSALRLAEAITDDRNDKTIIFSHKRSGPIKKVAVIRTRRNLHVKIGSAPRHQ